MKYLSVVAFVLLVLTGAMGLRNIASVQGAKTSGSSLLAQGRPFPPPLPGGPGH
jgi:hypothetical protein